MSRKVLTEEQRERSNEANRSQDRSEHTWPLESFRFDKPDEDYSSAIGSEELFFRDVMHGHTDDINDFELIIRGAG